MSIARRPFSVSVAMCSSTLRISTSVVVWIDAAVTSAGPRTSRRSVTGSSAMHVSTRSFRFRMTSVTSSLTPAMVSNSWSASSKRTCVTAAPGIDDSSVRRRLLPSVCPNPGSSGEMLNRWVLPSGSSASISGRWMMSMELPHSGARSAPGLPGGLLGVELDDELFAHRYVDLVPEREIAHGGLAIGDVEPHRDLPVDRVEVVPQHDHVARLRCHLDDVVLADHERRDRDPLAVHEHVAVADPLARLVATRRVAGPEHDVVQSLLEHAEQVLAGDALLAGGLGVEVAELLLEHAVDAPRLLLLAQLEHVLALTDATAAVQTRRVRPALDRALHRVALGALEEELHPLAPAEPADGSGVSRHDSDPPPLGGAATVVRDRRDVLDAEDLDAGVLDRPDRGLATGARALHHDVDPAHTVLHGPARRGLGRELRHERRALAGALEADVAGRRPRQHVALLVRDRDDRVVERGLDVRDAVRDVLAFTPSRTPSSCLGLCHLLASLLLAGDRLLRTLARARVRARPLTAHGQTATVADPAVRADLDLALDVTLDLAAEVTLDLEVRVDEVAQMRDLVLGEIADPRVGREAGLLADQRRGAP